MGWLQSSLCLSRSELLCGEETEVSPLIPASMSQAPEWLSHYAFLNGTDQQNPIHVINITAEQESLFDDRSELFDLFYAFLSSEQFNETSADEGESYIALFRRLVLLLEACHRVHELIDKKQLLYSYVGDVAPK